MDKVLQAKWFAKGVHHAHLRKYTNEPYANHLQNVVNILKNVDATEDMLCAAWLHDAVEDHDVSFEQICTFFGADVEEYVFYLTDPKVEVGNRAHRKRLTRERFATASAEVQTIKLADLIDNTSSIVQYDPSFAVVYLKEKRDLLAVLTKGNKVLYERAMSIVS